MAETYNKLRLLWLKHTVVVAIGLHIVVINAAILSPVHCGRSTIWH